MEELASITRRASFIRRAHTSGGEFTVGGIRSPDWRCVAQKGKDRDVQARRAPVTCCPCALRPPGPGGRRAAPATELGIRPRMGIVSRAFRAWPMCDGHAMLQDKHIEINATNQPPTRRKRGLLGSMHA
jgi:hypothetical protein